MSKARSPYIIGLSEGCDTHCTHFARFSSKGFDIIECGPVESDEIRTIINSLTGKKRNAQIAINLKADANALSEEAILKNVEKKFSLLYDFADIFTFDLNHQNEDYSNDILDILTKTRMSYDEDKIILIRIAKALDEETTNILLSNCRLYGIDGVITENWESFLEKVNKRFPVYAEISGDHAEEAAISAIKAGVSAVLFKNIKPKRRLAKAIHNIEV